MNVSNEKFRSSTLIMRPTGDFYVGKDYLYSQTPRSGRYLFSYLEADLEENWVSDSLCDVRGALLKYLLFNFRSIVQKCMYSSHNMRTKRHQKALLHYAKTSNLTENSIQDKAVNFYNICKEIGLWPVGIDKDQNKRFHRFRRDILNLYLNNSDDISAFSK